MATSSMNRVIGHLRRAALGPSGGGVTDEQLLDDFIDRRDEAAFAALVRRHGPMVLGVCRRVIGHAQDAEDAFQATFLILVHKATSLGQRELVGNWLYGVAYRTALEARSRIARRHAREKQVNDMPHPTVETEAIAQELKPLLDQELDRLPDKYRLPLVLCHLEGRTRQEVARQLQIPEGTLSSRLATARRTLAERLTRRGLAISAGALAAILSPNALSAGVPTPLLMATVRAAAQAASAPGGVAGTLSANVVALMDAVLKTTSLSRAKLATAVLLLTGTLLAATAELTDPAAASDQAAAAAESAEQQAAAQAGKDKEMILKTERFDKDPGWEAHNNRIVPERVPTVIQDFGFSKTKYAGKGEGELGGRVTRASEPAFYADKLGPLTLDDKLSASGTFALTKTTAGGGVFFGFFRSEQPGGGGRPTGSLGMDMDCERGGARLAVRLITGKNQSCGTFITPFIPGKFRPTSIRNDGTRYTWKLDYDPQGAGGRGRFTFTLHGDAPKPGAFEKADVPEAHKQHARTRFPDVNTFTVDLPEGYKQHGTTFDHFGLMNMMKPGGFMTIYFGDLQYNGRTPDFSQDPKWDAAGNRATYPAKDVGGAHDFGFSPTNHAGGQPGEVGGIFWRSGKYGYYADRVGPLSLDDRLEASGKVVLKSAGPDSDMFLGWFNGTNQETPPTEAGHFLGVHVGGPTRVGHYFHPSLATAKGTRAQAKTGPLLVPGTVYDWSLVYDPTAEDGNGAIRVTLGKETVTLPLRKGVKGQGASFNRFGLFTSNIGGQMVRIYLDDLKYTAARR